jgi:two-component system cell cycle sensor histidine kinase/response regulator CckA
MTRPELIEADRHSRLLEAMPAIVWSASADTFRFNYISPAAEQILGYPAERWIDEPTFWLEHLHPDDRHVALLCHNETIACRNHELVYRMIAADGREVWLRDYVNVHTVDGVPVELFGVMVNITRERHAEAAWRESRENFRHMVELSPDCIGVHADGRWIYVNQTFVDLLGAITEDEVVGRDLLSVIAPRFHDVAKTHLDMLRAGKTVPYFRQKFVRIDGTLVDVEAAALPMRYGSRDAVQVIARDITDRVRAEAESARAQNALEEAKRMSSLGQLAASLAHEFNNVLMGIQPFVEIISRNAPPGRGVSEAIGHITRSISRGKRASQEILRFANPKEPNLFSIDVRTWLATLLGQLQASLPPTISLTHSIGDGVAFMRGDSEQLELVITNLVFNARDAIGASSGQIDVAVSSEERRVRMSVTDDGPGIPPDMVRRVFEPLFTTKRNGTGLGLAIAQRLMERQGGTVTAENRPTHGATFHVTVPAAQVESPVSVRPLGAPVLHVRRVLLVEDDASVGSGIEALLQSEGYETTWVRNWADVLPAALRSRPHVAIIDVNLPDGSGVDLVPLLRAQHVDLPIVLSTGHVELNLSNAKQHILSLMKPYELRDLLNAIGSVTAAA